MRASALEAGLPIVIGITLGEARVFHTALKGSSADDDGWLEPPAGVPRRVSWNERDVGERTWRPTWLNRDSGRCASEMPGGCRRVS
jgi:hypothetical protein